MPGSHHPSQSPRQQGVILITLFALLGVSALYLLIKQFNTAQLQITRDQITTAALIQAKEALIGRAVNDNNRPGVMSCPDIDDDGSAESPISYGGVCPSYIGRLPWKTLDLPDLRDGNGDRLWYALSSSLRDDASAQPINSSTPGNLTVDSTNQIAAIIFSPGPPLATQVGRPSNNVADYLDGSNADADNNYTSGLISSRFNDRLMIISRDELFRAVNKRIVAEVRGSSPLGTSGSRLLGYYANPIHHEYPWAAAINNGVPTSGTLTGFVPYNVPGLFLPTWLASNGWYDLITYSVAPEFQPGTAYPQHCIGTCITVGNYTQAQASVTITSTTTAMAICSTNLSVLVCP